VPTDLAEPLAAELFARGALGLEESEPTSGRAELAVYFPRQGVDEAAVAAVAAALGATEVAWEPVEPTDWLARYREQARPLLLGRSFLADPRDPDDPGEPASAEGRRTLRLPARTAFGTGSHESTRLAVELLEQDPPVGARVLDVGTGTGVLSYVALILGARRVVGVDIDPAAALVGGQIAALNRLEPLFVVGGVGCLRPEARFDRVLVNIIPAHWRGERETVRRLVAPEGRLLVSGLLVDQRSEVVGSLAEAGFEPVAERAEGGWLAMWLAGRERHLSRRR
jgi:ribosomal protein L11 methyltransferase